MEIGNMALQQLMKKGKTPAHTSNNPALSEQLTESVREHASGTAWNATEDKQLHVHVCAPVCTSYLCVFPLSYDYEQESSRPHQLAMQTTDESVENDFRPMSHRSDRSSRTAETDVSERLAPTMGYVQHVVVLS